MTVVNVKLLFFLYLDHRYIFLKNVIQQRAAQEELEKWRSQEKDAQEKLENDSKDLTKISAKQTSLRQKVDECTEKIKELGAMPNAELVAKFMSYSQKNVSVLYFITKKIKLINILTL